MLSSRALLAALMAGLLLQAEAVRSSAQETPQEGPGVTQPADQTETPAFRGGINFVRVDVIVHDNDDQPVTDLALEDFELFEDGKPQSIEQFTLVRVDGNPRPGDAPPREIRTREDEELIADREDVRIFVFFLDDYHTRQGNSLSVRRPLIQFIQRQLRPNDLVAIMYPLTSVRDLAFTRDHDRIARAIDSFLGRKFDYRPTNQFEANYMRYSTETVERIRNDVVMGALRGLSVRLGSIREGRKSVIFVSEGFTAMLPPQMRRPDASAPGDPFVAGAQAASQDSGRELTAEWFGQSDVYSRLREVYDVANRNNTAIYSLDPRGLAVFDSDFSDPSAGPAPSFATDSRALRMTQDTLRVLSEETDGRAIVNRNTLEDGLTQMVQDASYYYLIGYTSTEPPDDGKFHELRVNVKRRGVDVRARKGFWALTAADAIRAAAPAPEVAKPVELALASIATSVQAGKYVQTWFGAERGADGKTRVTLVWEPLRFPPGDRREPAGRLTILAATGAGDLVFRGHAPERPSPDPVTRPQRLVFDTAPGTVELRVTVEGAGGSTLDQEIRELQVPDFTTPQVTLSTPQVYRARTIPELRTIAADPDAVPVAGREFSRTERVLIRFHSYGPGATRPVPTAMLLNRGGDTMAAVPVTEAASGGTHEINLGLASFPAGEYLVQITVPGADGEATELIPLRIVS
jgi:VWFA-related protein